MRYFYQQVIRLRWMVIGILVAVTTFLGSALLPVDQIKYDFSLKRLFHAYGGDGDALQDFHATFGDDVGFLSVLYVMPEQEDGLEEGVSGTVYAPQVIRELETLTQWFKQRSEIAANKVFSLSELAYLHGEITPRFMPGALADLEAVATRYKLSAQQAVTLVEEKAEPVHKELDLAVKAYQSAAKKLQRHRIYRGRMVSNDARATAVVARYSMEVPDAAHRHALIHDLEAKLPALKATMPPGTELHLAGMPVLNKTHNDLTTEDILLFMPIISAMMCLFLFLLFRQFRAIALPMLGVGLATIWTMGLMQTLGEPINILSNVIPVVVLVIGVAESVHIITRYYQECHAANNSDEALVDTMCHVTRACFLASLTTAIGFASLISATIPAVRGFGVHAAYGIVFTFIIQITVLPVGLSFFKLPPKGHIIARKGTLTSRWLTWMGALVLNRPRRVLVIAGALMIAMIPGIMLVEHDSKVLEELGPEHPVSQSLYKTQQHLSGVLIHAVMFSAKEYPERSCQRDDDCRNPACDPSLCGFADCCHTQICKKRDGAWHLVNSLRRAAKTMIDVDDVAIYASIQELISNYRSQSYGASDTSLADDDDDLIIIEDDDSPIEKNDLTSAAGYCAESVKNSAFIHYIAGFDDWLTHLDKEIQATEPTHPRSVSRVTSLVDLIREFNVAMSDTVSDQSYQLPQDLDRAYLAETLSTLRRDGDMLGQRLDPHETKTHVSLLSYDSGTEAWRRIRHAMEDRLRNSFDNTVGLGDRFDWRITGSSTLAHGANESIVKDISTSIGLAFIIILVLVSTVFRSIRIGLISMIPNLVPLLATLAFMGFCGMNLRVSTVIVFSISLGIAVDDTVHFLARFDEEMRGGKQRIDAALMATLNGTGRAIVLSTIILAAGFIINTMSEFTAVQQFGLLSSITLVIALLFDLFVLPIIAKHWRLYRH